MARGKDKTLSRNTCPLLGLPSLQQEDPRPTPAEIKEAFASHIQQRHGPDAPLMTSAMREREEARLGIKKKEYTEVSSVSILAT